MDIGFIGAGKVGTSLGRYLKQHRQHITGYYSRNPLSAKEAAEFTGSKYFSTLKEAVGESEVLFLTVPDGQIGSVWTQIQDLPVAGKIICHCSGLLSSAVFSEISQKGAFGYSIHPLLAVSQKFQSNQSLSQAVFTVEGAQEKRAQILRLLKVCGNPVVLLDAGAKEKYHAAAVMASNLVLALNYGAQKLLTECGFAPELAAKSLTPLFLGNAQTAADKGLAAALTGPVERLDLMTVSHHLSALEGADREIYRLLSLYAVELARQKHPQRNYEELKGRLEQ